MSWLAFWILSGMGYLFHRRTIRWLNHIEWRLQEMATQEQIDELVANLSAVAASISGIAADQAELKRLLEEADSNNPNLDLSAALALSESLVAATSDLDSQFPAPEPEDETDEALPPTE